MISLTRKIRRLHPDLAARHLLMAAHLYYDHGQPIMSDHEYDEMAKYVVMNWDALHPTRVWQLVGKKMTLATGMHFKFTTLTIDASHSWYLREKGSLPHLARYCTSIMFESPTNGHYAKVRG